MRNREVIEMKNCENFFFKYLGDVMAVAMCVFIVEENTRNVKKKYFYLNCDKKPGLAHLYLFMTFFKYKHT